MSTATATAPRQTSPRARTPLVALVVAAGALAVGALVFGLTRPPAQGPLADGLGGASAQGNGYGLTLAPGETGAASLYTGKLSGSKEAVLESIEPVHPEQALGLRPRYALLVEGPGGTRRGWPVPGSIALEGGRVAPGHYGVIWVGLTASEPGRYRIDNFRLRYRVGGSLYETYLHETVVLRVRRGA